MKRTLVTALLLASPALAFAGGKAGKARTPRKDGGKAMLSIQVEPPSKVFVDGKERGRSDKLKLLTLAPGAHIVRVVYKRDEHEDQVILKKGETVQYQWKFEDDKPAAPAPAQDESGDAQKPAGDAKPEEAARPADPAPAASGEPSDPKPDEPVVKDGRVMKKDPLEGIKAQP